MKPTGFKMPGMKGPKAAKPTTHIGSPPKIHPAATPHVRLPQGEVDTSSADPAPIAPGVGKF